MLEVPTRRDADHILWKTNEDQGKIPDDKVLELKKMPSLHTCFSSLICYIKIFFVESNN